MRYRAGRDRAAVFLGLAVVIALAQELHDYQIAPLSGLGLLIIVPTLLIASLLLSFIVHGDQGR